MIKWKKDMRAEVRHQVRDGAGYLELHHVFEPEELENKATMFATFTFDPGDSIGPHPHPNDGEVYYILEGELTVTENGGMPVVLRAGDAAYLPQGESHMVENRSHKPAVMLAIILP